MFEDSESRKTDLIVENQNAKADASKSLNVNQEPCSKTSLEKTHQNKFYTLLKVFFKQIVKLLQDKSL